MRGLVPNLNTMKPYIRVNAIAPSWTATGMVPKEFVENTGIKFQGPEVPARSAVVLMADKERQGQLIYSVVGRFFEIEDAVLLKSVTEQINDKEEENEDETAAKLAGLVAKYLAKPQQTTVEVAH